MPELRESTTFVLSRGEHWKGKAASEPYEAGWASEAIVFARCLGIEGPRGIGRLFVQISPDGMNWVDEGASLAVPRDEDETTFAKVSHFGNWLRLRAELPDGTMIKLLATLHLKG